MRRNMLTILAALATAACGGSTNVSPDTLDGSWNAAEYEYVNAQSSAQSVDLVADSSYAIQFVFGTQLTGQASFVRAGSSNSSTFSYNADGTRVIINNDTLSAALGNGGDRLTLTGNIGYDFTGDGADERANARLVLNRIQP